MGIFTCFGFVEDLEAARRGFCVFLSLLFDRVEPLVVGGGVYS